MKTAKSLTQLATELTRQQEAKRDFLADTKKLTMLDDGRLAIDGNTETLVFETQKHFDQQLASELSINSKYWDKMPAHLRATNVNHWFQAEPEKRMVRTLDGKARAFLSDKYRALDNFDLAEAVLPVLAEVPDMQIVSSELTEQRMFIKALFPRIQGEVAKGDIVQSGVVISNSETGNGSLRVEPLVYRLVCLNGMISNISTRKYHVGRGKGSDDQAREVFRDATIQAHDRAFWMGVQDTVRASVNQKSFDAIVQGMAATQGWKIEQNPVEVIERVKRSFLLGEGESKSILHHLIKEGDMTGYGLLNAITRASQDIDDYTRATEFERLGGQIIELKPSEWKALAIAA